MDIYITSELNCTLNKACEIKFLDYATPAVHACNCICEWVWLIELQKATKMKIFGGGGSSANNVLEIR